MVWKMRALALAAFLWGGVAGASGDHEVVAPRGIEPSDESEFGKPAGRASAGQHGDDVDGLRDQGARHRDDGLLNELLKPAQGAERGAVRRPLRRGAGARQRQQRRDPGRGPIPRRSTQNPERMNENSPGPARNERRPGLHRAPRSLSLSHRMGEGWG